MQGATLATSFGDNIGALIAAKAIDIAYVSREDFGNFFVPAMRHVIAVTRPLTATPPTGLTDAQRGDLFLAHANALSVLGVQSGQRAPLIQAIQAYKTAVAAFEQSGRQDRWAMTQNNLGNALQALGEHEPGTDRLEQADTAFRDALLERTRDRVPLNWATTRFNMGFLHLTLFAKNGTPAQLDLA